MYALSFPADKTFLIDPSPAYPMGMANKKFKGATDKLKEAGIKFGVTYDSLAEATYLLFVNPKDRIKAYELIKDGIPMLVYMVQTPFVKMKHVDVMSNGG